MWCFTLLLLVGAVVAQSEHDHGWEVGKQYQYLVRSRTLSTLDQLKDQSSTGIAIKAVLTIQAVSADKLQAQLTKPQFARIHTLQSEGLDIETPDQKLEYQELLLSGKPFEIVVKHGMIRDLLVNQNIPTWELNLLKGIVSQLQLDTQGENALHDRSTQEPKDGLYGSYRTMEDTVGGKCEVLYDISPLSANDRYNLPELAPLLVGNENKQLLDIRKTKNYNNCKQQRGYHFGITGRLSLTRGSDYKDRLTTKSTDSRIVISGDLKQFTIQSSVTANLIFVKSVRSTNAFIGTVSSKMNLTLVKTDQFSGQLIPSGDENLVSTGNLLYTYNNPLTEIEQGKHHQQTISRNSPEVQSSSESSSSSSEQHQGKNWRKQGAHCCSSSSSSSSAVSSSEEFNHLQTVPSLNEAPKSMTPLSLALQDQPNMQNLVQEAQKQVHDITNNLQQVNNMQTQDTLERFANLVNMLRQLNDKQITEVEQGVVTNAGYDIESGEKSTVKNDAWNVIRDAVAQTGTGPGLLTIIRWVQSGKVQGHEAARIVSKIPKVARIPSENYIEAVFENLVANEKVQQQEFLSKVTPIIFSELVRKTQVDKRHSQNTYPIYNFGKLNSQTDKGVTEKYIPYMEKQLQKNLQNGDNAQAQVYIVALGNFGHPQVLKIFEPYLEGQQQVSTYMRTLMISSLRSLVQRAPGVVASVLYKIYLNEQESHEVRCAAVHLYMLTDPPLVSMMRMAKHTHSDHSQDVSAAVKSSIISLSKLRRPQFYIISQKARYARRLLTPKIYSATSSRGIFKDSSVVQIIGSEDSRVPKNLYVGAMSTFGNLAKSVFEMEYGVSSVRQLFDIFGKPEAHEQSAWLDQIRQSLGMQDKETEQVEGHFWVSSVIDTHFYPFDQQTIEKYATKLKNTLKQDQNAHINHMDSYEETVSFPTESGLPFTFSFEMPMLTRITFSKRQGSQSGGKVTTGTANVLYANKMQTRFGFVVSHEYQHHIAGVDKNLYVHIPVEYNVNIESKHPSYGVEVKMHVDPEIKSSSLKIMHRSVIPFTAQLNMLQLQPVSQSNVQRVVNTNELQKSSIRFGAMRIVFEQDRQQTYSVAENIMEWMTSLFDESINYKMVEIQQLFENGDTRRDETTVSVAYDRSESRNNGGQEKSSIHDTEIEITEKQPNSEARRKQLLQEVSKGLTSAKASVVDIGIEVPFFKSRQVLTIGVGESNVERQMQYLVYWNHQSQTGEVLHEAMITGTVKSTQEDFLRYDKAIQSLPEDEFTIVARIGKNYKQADKIVLQGRLLQTENLKETLLKSKIVHQCLHEMQLGKGLKPCQKAIEMALKKNLLQISMKFDSEEQRELATTIISYLGQLIPTADVEFTNLRNDLKNKINMEVKMSPDYENMETTIKTSTMNVKFNLQDTNDQSWEQDKNECLEDMEERALCSLSENEIVTFDRKSYPVHLGGVWHVLMIPAQQQVSKDMKLAVLAREVDNRIQVRALLETEGNREYMLLQSNNGLQALINGKEVDVSKERSFQDKLNGKMVAEIFTQPDGSLRLILKKLGLDILFDGKLVQLQASEKYRSSVVGLCGNYDNQLNNDFITPQNCILQKPEEFSSTYALLKNEDNDSSRKIGANKEKANRAVCTPLTSRQTNVINDREAGRIVGKQVWGYHQLRNQNAKNQETVQLIYRTKIDEDDQEICFSVRPLPMCPQNSNPAEMKRKNVAMHCMPKNQAAYEMKRRVENGANPDLAHKSINKKQSFEIPSACYTY